LQLFQHFAADKEALQGKIDQHMELEETRGMDFYQMEKNQDKVKETFDRKSMPRDFRKGDLVLMWEKIRKKPGMHQEFYSLWLGPYTIEEISRLDSFYLSTT
jgi:hypothetical protein